jgi:hypothetical protein
MDVNRLTWTGRVLQDGIDLLRRCPLSLLALHLVRHSQGFGFRCRSSDVESAPNFLVAMPRDEAREDPLELFVFVLARRAANRLPTLLQEVSGSLALGHRAPEELATDVRLAVSGLVLPDQRLT